MAAKKSSLEIATFGGGCFWGVEELFRQIKGVKETVVGYSGGTAKNPTYEQVCSGTTGHVETVQINFDPKETSYGKLLEVFWMSHNPVQANGQGHDIGTQYHGVIFYNTPEQKKIAEASKDKLNREKYNGKIATQIIPAKDFWPAEEYHQKYLVKNPRGYCHINVKEILKKIQRVE
jgi:peptide-methionine (S)-S-oxide reductase